MGNLLKTVFSVLRQCDDTKRRVHEREGESESRYVASPLPRHRVSLTATASFGFSGIPEEIRIRDINEKGLYFYTSFDMPIGANLDIVALLPPDITADGKGRRVHYEVKVARVERERGKEQYGVGASIRRCETFPLPTTTKSQNTAAAPTRAPAPAQQSVQPTKTVEENIEPAPKTPAPLQIPKIVEPVKEAPASVPIQKLTPPVEKTIAQVIEIRASAVIEHSASSCQQGTIQNRRAIVEKLATAALRAGITLEELIRLIDSGISPTELVDIIEVRLTAHVE